MTDESQGPSGGPEKPVQEKPSQAGQEKQVRLASIVAIDVVGFSSMSERDQRRAADAVEMLRTRISAIAEKNGGRIFNTAGDGFMLEFGSAGAALGFIQDMVDKRPKGQPPIRIGAHVGDVVVTVNNDLLGHGVNIAARLQSLAVPNTALVSGEFRSMARSSPSVAFQAKGRQPLENIDQKVQTFAILSNAQRAQRLAIRGAISATAIGALALLAFFGGQIEQVLQDSHVYQYVGLDKVMNAPTKASADATELKPIAAPVVATPAPAPTPAAAEPKYKIGQTFRDCDNCPEMTVIPGGKFTMGSPAKERNRSGNEGPQHDVAIKSLAIGKYEVTFAEWDACLAAGACGGFSPLDRGWGRGRRPVIAVSWDDAQAYVNWLNSVAKAPVYRLLSEAEWEYAARAGGANAYGASATIKRSNANFGGGKPEPVGSYAANAFGLYDLEGNANEWVQDCYAQTYTGAPADGAAQSIASCAQRVYRGGGYADPPSALRAANRRRASHGLRDSGIGFRVARELD